MWVQRLRREPAKPLARLVSTTAREPRPRLDFHALLLRRVCRITRYYGRRFNDPIFKTFNWIAQTPMVPKGMLHRSDITVHDYISWKPVILARNWDEFMHRLVQRGYSMPELDTRQEQVMSDNSQPPTWVVLYALCYKVKHESDAFEALALTYRHLPVAPRHLRPALLILMACWLAEHELLVPLQRVVDTLLSGHYETELQDFHLQLLLQLIAYASRSTRVSPILRHIVDSSGAHHFNGNTYDALLRSPFATPQLALALSRKMRAQAFSPTLRHLTRFIILYTKAGWERRARMVLRMVRLHMAEAKGDQVSADSTLCRVGRGVPILVSAETRFLSAFPSAEALHAYLQDLIAVEGNSALHEEGADITDADIPEKSEFDALEVAAAVNTHLVPFGRPERDLPAMPPGGATALVKSVGAWVNSVVVTSKDRSASSEYLRQVYNRAIQMHPTLRLHIPMHIAAIQGLIRRENYDNALELWDTMREHQPQLTREFLTIGIEVLTAAGRPMQALDLLYDGTGLVVFAKGRGRQQVPTIDTQAVNVFMLSLQRLGFTDAIFVLWEHMGTLFGVRPDTYTFNIMLTTARLASKCDPSIRGALAELGLGRFIGEQSGASEPSRESCFSQVETSISSEVANGSSGLWNGERAGAVALRVFREIIFSNWPELKDVASPAEALRSTGDFQGSFPMTSLLRTVLHRKMPTLPSQHDKPGAAIYATVPSFPHIVLSDIVFSSYIDLLASESQIPQIPLALAWMRTLGIRPTKSTLATALMYWAEVGMDAPLFEHIRNTGSQYERLQQWMREWVGDTYMPTDLHIAHSMQRLKQFREQSRRPRLDTQS